MGQQSLGGKQTTPGKKGGDVFNQAAAGMGNAGKATLAAGQGFAGLANDPTGGLGKNMGYTAAQQANPALIKAGISGYMNPYTNDVIKRTQADIQRQTQMGLGGIGDQAAGMGAFGGSRQGIAEGTAIGEGSRALGDISAQMRQQGWDTAAGLAGQDIQNRMGVAGANQAATNAARQHGSTASQQAANNRLLALQGLQSSGQQGAGLAGQAMGMGQGMANQQAQNGAQIQNMNQQLMGQSAGMFDQYVGQPMDSVAGILNLLSGNPLSGTGKTTQVNTPGVKSQLSGALGLAGRVTGA